MNASPYTWPQWQERFMRALRDSQFHGLVDISSFHWEWEQGEDPETVAAALVNHMTEE